MKTMKLHSTVSPVIALLFFMVIPSETFLLRSCDNLYSYNKLVQLMREDKCMSTDSVFYYLKDMTSKHHDGLCRDSAIRNLANYFGKNGVDSHCSCVGNNTFHKYGRDHSIGDNADRCFKHASYTALYNMFFINNQTETTSPCSSHHKIWQLLNQVMVDDSFGFCQRDIVYHISNAIQQYGDPCNCTVNCSDVSSYNELMALADAKSCMSVNSVWHILDDLEVKSPQCRLLAQQFLEEKFKDNRSSECVCNSIVPLKNENIMTMHNGSLRTCEHSSSYRGRNDQWIEKKLIIGVTHVIEGLFFSQIEQYGCQDHRHLWSALGNIHTVNGVNCQKDLIIRTALRYPSPEQDTCKCALPQTLTTPTTTTTTSSTTPLTSAITTSVHVTATSTDMVTSPTTMVTSRYMCNEIATLQSIATATQLMLSNTSVCDTDDGGSDDDFTRIVCGNLGATWYKGVSVMDACQANPVNIKPYTPIATFTNDVYISRGGQSGVFLKCNPNGFSMAVQYCNSSPKIIQIDTNGVLTRNPYYYFVLA